MESEVAEEAEISFGFDDDDDDFDNLFSFATAASELSTLNENSGDAPESTQKDGGMTSLLPSTLQSALADDSNMSATSEDSFLEFLEQQKEPLTLLEATKGDQEAVRKGTASTEDSSEEILDWLDKDDEKAAALHAAAEEPIAPPQPVAHPPIPTAEDLAAATQTHFETLDEAVRSSKSTIQQVRMLLSEEGFAVSSETRPHLWCKVICGKTLTDVLESSVADSFRQWQKQQQTRQNQQEGNIDKEKDITKADGPSEAQDQSPEQAISSDSPATGESEAPTKSSEGDNVAPDVSEAPSKPVQESTSDVKDDSKDNEPANESLVAPPPFTKYQRVQIEWIERQAKVLAPRVMSVRPGKLKDYEQQISELLQNHFLQAPSHGALGGDEDVDEFLQQIQDPLLPPIVCCVVAAGLPTPVTAVFLSKMISQMMPLVGLTRREREAAGLSIHDDFHRLAAYHLPSLVLHLDRYLPDWFYWPTCQSRKSGFIPQSFLMSHLAGEVPLESGAAVEDSKDESSAEHASSNQEPASKGFLMEPQWLLSLWDVILASTNNSLRFFFAVAILEAHADQLILLTGQELRDELGKVMSFETDELSQKSTNVANETGADACLKDANRWVRQWTDRAQLLWERTPLSISRRLKKSEDKALKQTLIKRQLETEERAKRKQEAEAKAHQEALDAERERKADEARLRLTRARLVAFYRQYNPGKETNIDKIIEAYKGRFEVLDAKLKQKYGVGFNPALKPKSRPVATSSSKTTTGSSYGGFMGTKAKEITDRELAEERRKSQIVAKTAPSEVVPSVCWSKESGKVNMNKLDRGNKMAENDDGRLRLHFHIVDSRPTKTAREQGRFTNSTSLTPDDFIDPDRLLEKEKLLEEMRGSAHIVIMGEGFAALTVLYGHKMSSGLAECIRTDDGRNLNCALFFLKMGFPFVSIMDGGFAGAHSFLYRQGTNYNLHIQSVLSDYDPEVSMFGQFEFVRNSSGQQKAQRALQNIFDSSLVALTKNTKRFESLTSEMGSNTEDKSQKRAGGNMMTRFFAGSVSEEQTMTTEAQRETPVKEPAAGQGPKFRNLFGRKNEQSLDRGNSQKSLTVVEVVEDIDKDNTEEKATSVAGKPNAAKEASPAPKVSKPDIQTTLPEVSKAKPPPPRVQQSPPKSPPKKVQPKVNPSPQTKKSEPPKANPFSGFGAAWNNSLKAASKVAGEAQSAAGRQRNPFARFGAASVGMGNSQHGKTNTSGNAPSNEAQGAGMARNLAGFNQFRKNTMARMRNDGSDKPDSS